MFCASAGLLIDVDLQYQINRDSFSLAREWVVELKQQWRHRQGQPQLTLLVAGLRWEKGAGRGSDQPRCCDLHQSIIPTLVSLAEDLQARLVILDETLQSTGLSLNDLLEAPLLLLSSARPIETDQVSTLLKQPIDQLVTVWQPAQGAECLMRERYWRGLILKDEAVEKDLPKPIEQLLLRPTPQDPWVLALLGPAAALILALLTGMVLWKWSGRLAPGLMLLAGVWWWLKRQPWLANRNRLWCRHQLLEIQRLWADFRISERVRDQLHERRLSRLNEPQLLQELQAHRLWLELVSFRPRSWQRADLADALNMFTAINERLRRAHLQHRRRGLMYGFLAVTLLVVMIPAIGLDQSWTDALVLPVTALVAWLALQQPLPNLSAPRCQRAIHTLQESLIVFARAQRCDELMQGGEIAMAVERAVFCAGREVIDLVNDSFDYSLGH